VVKVITSIAYHTNRLALDAAVQASMAGVNGKGFEVVALDIRALSEQTKKQANLIAGIVNNINENISKAATAMRDTERETARGSELALQAGIALGSIFAGVEREAKEIQGISVMADNQLKSSHVVVRTMQAVSDAARKSNATTREASQNMWQLAHLVAQLRTSVAAFKLRDQNYGLNKPKTISSNL
jgi:methyl-accepting chemotaxis protein